MPIKYTAVAIMTSITKHNHADKPENNLRNRKTTIAMKADDSTIENASIRRILTFIICLETIIIVIDTVNSAITDAIAAPF